MKIDFLDKANKTAIVAVGIITTVIITALDYITSVEISFSVFYLIPISIVTWYLNKKAGLVFSVLCAALWMLADSQNFARFSSPAIPYWNALVRLCFFIIVTILLGEIKAFKGNLENLVEEKTRSLKEEIIRRIKTEDELKYKTEVLSSLTKSLQNIREEESTKIAREIHDELGQALSAVKIELMWLVKKYPGDTVYNRKIMQVSEIVEETIKNVRRISASLRPKLLDQLGFLPAIEWQLKEFERRTRIKCELDIENDNIKLNPIASSTMFRIFQESLTNIARHSRATRAELSLDNKSDILTMTIKDNGIGFSKDYKNKKHSLGIVGMQERAHSLGGVLNIDKYPGGGTQVIVNIPLTPNMIHD
jgi:signal transduction histidine kinase